MAGRGLLLGLPGFAQLRGRFGGGLTDTGVGLLLRERLVDLLLALGRSLGGAGLLLSLLLDLRLGGGGLGSDLLLVLSCCPLLAMACWVLASRCALALVCSSCPSATSESLPVTAPATSLALPFSELSRPSRASVDLSVLMASPGGSVARPAGGG